MKFAIVVTFIATIGISFVDSYVSYNYKYELREICNNLNETYTNKSYYFLDDVYDYKENYSIKNECKFYSNNNTKNNNLYNSFFFKISLVNVKNYRRLYYVMDELRNNNYTEKHTYKIIININNDKKFESTIINLSCNNYLCIINIFVFYLVSIFFLYNKSNVANYNTCTIGDYAILLTNLNDIYELFKNNLEDITKEEFKNKNKKLKKKYSMIN